MVRLILFSLFLAAAFQVAGAELFRGSWQCTALGPSHLALTGDYTELQEKLFQKHFAARQSRSRRKMPGWAVEANFNLAGTEAIAEYRPQVVKLLNGKPQVKIAGSAGPLAVVRTGYWMNPVGQSRFRDGKGVLRLSRNADTAHFLFLTLSRPLAPGEKVTITLPAGETVTYTWSPESPTPLFKIDQVGYMPAARKVAYVGAWLGTAGPLPLWRALEGKAFRLLEAGSGKVLFSGKLRARMPDPVNAGGTPFTGEEVLEMDFSPCTTPGVFCLEIPGVGRSYPFRIGDDTMAEAFFIHARGLFHQRCGIAKQEPFTHWLQKPCHQTSVRGTFPPDVRHYGKGPASRPYGFRDILGKSVQVNHFELIRQNPPKETQVLHAPGGWHDAGDWDRRPPHMGISGDLCAVYLLRPGNFCDGQLNLPESGNGIPDILDEARWGLEHLRLKQQRDGGVGSWEETVRHPRPGEGMASDEKRIYYLSCATRNSTLEYAAYASLMALAMRKAGAEKIAAEFRDSARKAWNYALNTKRPAPKVFHQGKKVLFYREEIDLAPELLVKAGYNLFLLTGEEAYLHKAEDSAAAAVEAMKKESWRWSPLFWMELEVFPPASLALDKLRETRRRALVKAAETMLSQQEKNYPIRIAWYGPRDGWVHSMSWGTFHPLVRARTLIAAHALTGKKAFWDGACLANDFNNGANPSGSSMTSGLGRVYPVRFLDLNSYADGIAEQIPGITPYRNTYGIPRSAVRLAYGLFYGKNRTMNFPGIEMSLLPRTGLSEESCVKAVGRLLPIWRRWGNVETATVGASEYTVWETIGPAAAVTGYLLNGASKPDARWIERRPAADVRKLPGYAPLP
ncbi:MAG: glycoside hydrolase family 9 protein [Lentisphaeria bacterium]|nr:glycoside hydrolase family 9 protein [Lentisphaeria bacterium]